jgi:hypothetical protein
MSRHFFCAFILIMLLASVDLNSMHDPRTHLTDSETSQKQKQGHTDKESFFNTPSSLANFKRQSIALPTGDHYSLIFNRNQQPYVTHYVLDGKCVAQLTQIGDEINFESNNGISSHFSLQIPYQAGSLTINTQNRIALEKTVGVSSAYLIGKAINFYDQFLSDNSLTIEANDFKSYAQVTCSDFLFKGNVFENMPRSSLRTDNSLTSLAQRLMLNDGTIDCKKETFIKSSVFTNEGAFTSHNMRFGGNKISNQGMLIIGNTFCCASKLFEHNGTLEVANNCIMEKGNTFSSGPSSVLNVKGDWKSFVDSMQLNGSFNVTNVYLTGKNFISESLMHWLADNVSLKMNENVINAGTLKIQGLLKVDSRNLTLEKTSCIKTNDADLKVTQAIENKGIVSVKNHLASHSRSMSNRGRIETHSSDIQADRYFYNKIFSTLSAKSNLTIHTPLVLNLLGYTHAQQLMINSAIGLNALGIYAAKNMTVNSLFSLNAGLVLPKFNTLREMTSWQNVCGLGESLFIKHIPVFGILYATFKAMQGFYYHGKTLWGEADSAYEQKNMCASTFIALICLTKNMLNATKQTSNLGNQVFSLLFHRATAKSVVPECPPALSDILTKAKDIARETASATVSHYAPGVNTDSFMDVNYGIAIGGNNSSTCQYNHNSNTSLYAQNTIATFSGTNTGYLGACNLNISAATSYRSNNTIGMVNGAIQTHYLSVIGNFNILNDIKIDARTARLDTDIKANKMAIKSDNFSLTGTIDVANGVIDASKLRIKGPINAQQNILLKGNRSVYIDGDIKAKNIQIQSEGETTLFSRMNSSFTHVRSKIITNNKDITSECLVLEGDSIRNRATLKAPKTIITQANPDDEGWCASRRAFVNEGTVKASDELIVDARNVNLTKGSQVIGPKALFKCDGYWKNNGNMNNDLLAIEAQNTITNNGSLNVLELQTKSAALHLDKESHTKAKTAYFQTSSEWKNDGKLETEKCFIDSQKKVINNGFLNSLEVLQVKAPNIFFQTKSCVNTKDAYYKADYNVLLGGITNTEKGTIDAGGNVTSIGKFGASDQIDINATNISIEETSHFSARKACLKASGAISNGGTFSASELLAHAKFVENLGKMTIATKAHIKADRLFWNLCGSITAESDLTIDALILLNTFGYIGAENLRTNAILDLNLLGIYQGCNISQHSLIGYNKGILIPQFKSLDDLQKLLTQDNALRLAESLAMQYCPSPLLATIYPLVKPALYFMISKKRRKEVSQVYDKIKKNIQELSKKEDCCVSDVVPILCDAKSMITSVLQTGHQAYGVASDAWNNKLFEIQISKNIFTPIFSTPVLLFGPQLSRNSLLDVNHGLIIGVNGNSQSLYNLNSGASLFANNYSINTIFGTNTGFIGGGNISINAFASYLSDATLAAVNFSMIANNLKVGGSHYAFNNASFKAHNYARMDRKINARNITVQATTLHLKNGSHIDANSLLINAQKIHGEKGNTITSTNGTTIKTNNLDNKGTMKGLVALEFNGEIDQLKSIGDLEQLVYKGSLDGNTADKLTNGHNELLNVTKGGSVIIDAQEQDVHLKEQHDIAHTLRVETRGSIQCDKDLLSEKSLWLQAKGNVHHALLKSKETTGLIGKNISSKGYIIREECGENYSETCERSKVYGNQIIIHAEENLEYASTDVHSGIGGTQLYVGKKLIADALKVESHRVMEEIETGTIRKNKIKTITITEETATKFVPCSFTSDGIVEAYVLGGAELHGTHFCSKGGSTHLEATITEFPTPYTSTQKKETRKFKKNKIIDCTKLILQIDQPIKFQDKNPPVIISKDPISLHLECNAPSITIDAPEIKIWANKQSIEQISSQDKSNCAVDKGGTIKSHDVTSTSSYNGIINTTAHAIHIEDPKNGIPAIINSTYENAIITRSLIEDVHKYQKKSYIRPTPLTIGVVGLALSIVMQSLGATAGAALASRLAIRSAVTSTIITHTTSGAICGLWDEALKSLLHCNGNMRDAAKEFASTETMRNLAINTLASVSTAGMSKILDKTIPAVSQAITFPERLKRALPREIVSNSIGFATDVAHGKKPKKAAKDRAKKIAANTLGVAASAQIGKAYSDKKIGFAKHKALHAGLGAAEGAICNGKKGAIAGAIGAGVAETVADIMSPKAPSFESIKQVESQLGRLLTQDEFASEWNRQLSRYFKKTHSVADASKMIATTVALLAHQDPHLAQETATKAVDNNFVAVLTYGIMGAQTAYRLYQIPTIYEEKGTLEAFKYLGIEVIAKPAGEFIAGRLAGATIFKVGTTMYPSAKQAVNAALNVFPGARSFLGNITQSLITAGEKLANTGIGKGIAEVGKYVQPLERKIIAAENKAFDKVLQNINPSFAADLVETAVPTQILNKVEGQLVSQAAKESAQQLALPAPEKFLLLPAPGKATAVAAPEIVNKVEEQLASQTAKESAQQLALPAPEKMLLLPPPSKTTTVAPENSATQEIAQQIGKIKSFPTFESAHKHIFSGNHVKEGIMNLGPTEQTIHSEFIKIIREADIKNLLKEGPNNIVTKINGYEVTIRAFLKDNHILSYNAFMQLSNRRVDNKIYL